MNLEVQEDVKSKFSFAHNQKFEGGPSNFESWFAQVSNSALIEDEDHQVDIVYLPSSPKDENRTNTTLHDMQHREVSIDTSTNTFLSADIPEQDKIHCLDHSLQEVNAKAKITRKKATNSIVRR